MLLQSLPLVCWKYNLTQDGNFLLSKKTQLNKIEDNATHFSDVNIHYYFQTFGRFSFKFATVSCKWMVFIEPIDSYYFAFYYTFLFESSPSSTYLLLWVIDNQCEKLKNRKVMRVWFWMSVCITKNLKLKVVENNA